MNALPKHPEWPKHAASALELFRLGWGTDRIAVYWSIDEAEALRRVNIERAQKLRLPNPYEASE